MTQAKCGTGRPPGAAGWARTFAPEITRRSNCKASLDEDRLSCTPPRPLDAPRSAFFGWPNSLSEVVGNSLTNNEVGLQLTGALHGVFHNSIHGNSTLQVDSQGPVELSDTRPASPAYGEGNYWGRACPAALFVAGVDSNGPNVIDSHPFRSAGVWSNGDLPGCPTLPTPVLTSPVDGALLAIGSPPFLGTAVVGATVELMEGGTVRGSAQVLPMGAFFIAPSVPFPEGFHEVAVRARLNGSNSAVSSSIGFTVESIVPAAPTIKFPTTGLALNGTSVVVAGVAEPDAAVFVSEGGAVIAMTVADPSGNFHATAQLPSGPHTITAVAKDAAFNPSPPSSAVSFSIVVPSTAMPLLGAAGKVRVTSLLETGDPFVPSLGESNTIRIEGEVSLPWSGGHSGYANGNSGNGIGNGRPSFRVEFMRQVTDASTGRAVASYAVTATISQSPAAGNVGTFSITTTWPGVELPGGGYAPEGAYLGTLTLRVVRDPRAPIPPGPSPIPDPNCAPGRGPPGCVLDVLEMLDPISLLGRQPDRQPVLPPPEQCPPPRFGPNGEPEVVIGERMVIFPQVIFGGLRVDSAAFDPNAVVHSNADGSFGKTGLRPSTPNKAFAVYPSLGMVTVALTLDCPQHEPGKPHAAVPCWTGTFDLPKPGRVRIAEGVSGLRVPRVDLSSVLTQLPTGPANAGLLGTRAGAVSGTFDRSGLRFFTRVPAIYNNIGFTAEQWDYRPTSYSSDGGYKAVYFDWDHDPNGLPLPSSNPDVSHPLGGQVRWLSKLNATKFEYFADWKTDQTKAEWVGDEPFSGCPLPQHRFANPRSFAFSGARLGAIEKPIDATAVFAVGTTTDPGGTPRINFGPAVPVSGDFKAVLP